MCSKCVMYIVFISWTIISCSTPFKSKIEIAETIEDDCTYLGSLSQEELIGLVETSNDQGKTSPNCTIILKVYYSKCNHIIETSKKIENAEVNMTEKELKEKFSDWEIQKFTPTEIVLYKEVDDFCNEHFMIKEKNGYIAIYKLNENETPNFFETTEISTKYLSNEDLEEIRKGIKVYTKKELNRILEDFE